MEETDIIVDEGLCAFVEPSCELLSIVTELEEVVSGQNEVYSIVHTIIMLLC